MNPPKNSSSLCGDNVAIWHVGDNHIRFTLKRPLHISLASQLRFCIKYSLHSCFRFSAADWMDFRNDELMHTGREEHNHINVAAGSEK